MVELHMALINMDSDWMSGVCMICGPTVMVDYD